MGAEADHQRRVARGVELATEKPGRVLCVVGPTASGKTELAVDICERINGEVVSADSVQINRAIQNVMINALQASAEKKGSVSVDCTPKEFYVDIRVQDTGAGITPEQMNKIFDPYFTTKQGKSGTGLGLYITKKVVEDHNGSIKVDSTPDVGTTFTIRLPLPQ